MNVIIVLPAYNEELSLPSLLIRINKAFQRYQWTGEIIVVNDGSKDRTLEVASSFSSRVPVTVLDFQPNRGLAGAIHAGLEEAAGRVQSETDVVVTLDADDSHNPFLIERMLNQIYEGSDVVIATRYVQGARILGLTRTRKLFSWMAGLLFRIFVGFQGVKDYTCGFRAYRSGKLKEVMECYQSEFITQKGFGCMVEILLKMGAAGSIIHEVPMILRYDRKKGESKMNVKNTIMQTLCLLYDYRTNKLIPPGRYFQKQ